jgi:hypothetical protein
MTARISLIQGKALLLAFEVPGIDMVLTDQFPECTTVLLSGCSCLCDVTVVKAEQFEDIRTFEILDNHSFRRIE